MKKVLWGYSARLECLEDVFYRANIGEMLCTAPAEKHSWNHIWDRFWLLKASSEYPRSKNLQKITKKIVWKNVLIQKNIKILKNPRGPVWKLHTFFEHFWFLCVKLMSKKRNFIENKMLFKGNVDNLRKNGFCAHKNMIISAKIDIVHARDCFC